MKVIYSFDPYEDAEDLKLFQKAHDHSQAVYEVTLAIRNYRKYEQNDDPDELGSGDDLVTQVKKLKALVARIDDVCQGMGYWER